MRPDWLEHPLDTHNYHPLDALHYIAIAFNHCSSLRMPAVEAFEISVGSEHRPTTVRQLLQAINVCCLQPALVPGSPEVQCTSAELYFDLETEFDGLQFDDDFDHHIINIR